MQILTYLANANRKNIYIDRDRIELRNKDTVAFISNRFHSIESLSDKNHLALISGAVLKKGSSIRLKIEGIRAVVIFSYSVFLLV